MVCSTLPGKRLLPQLVDDVARSNPDRIVYSVALSADISRGFRDITARGFADAVNKTSWWLHKTLGKSDKFATIAYIGPHPAYWIEVQSSLRNDAPRLTLSCRKDDLRYFLLILACNKTGHQLLILSPNNSREGAAGCINATKCRVWAQPHGQPPSPVLAALQETHDLQVIEVPACDELLDAQGAEHFPFNKTFDEAASEPFCVLHSSGSTGLPKIIPVAHGVIATQDAMQLLDPVVLGDEELLPWPALFTKGSRIYSPNALLHATAIIIDLLMTFFFETHCILGPVDVEPTMELFSSLADHGNIDIWFGLPQYIMALAQAPETLAKVARSRFICTAGGPMSPESGALVNEQIRVFNMTGTSEGFMSTDLLVARDDFLYFAWHPNSRYDFREYEPGVYEHWIVRDKEQEAYQGIFYTFPDVDEVNMKDLYTKHPTKPGYWLYFGRNDDVLALTDGTKMSPTEIQSTVADHPAVRDCLMVGTGKPTPSLLIELNEPKPQRPGALQELIDSIHVQVQKADSSALYKGYLHDDCVILADPERPFVRTDKLTVKRRETLALYERDIESFYAGRQVNIVV